MKLLLIEDNHALAERIVTHIPRRFSVDAVASGEAALAQAGEYQYDIVVLDLGLPRMSGNDVCRTLRKRGYRMPILVLTALDDMASRVELLNSGADDYMTKPFDTRELSARINALARRSALLPIETIMTVGDLVVSRASRTVRRAGRLIELRRKEYDILEYLVANQGRIVTREMIVGNVWPTRANSWGNTVDVHIKNLRDRIDRPFATPLIKTAYGIGYRVEAPEEVTAERKITL